MATPYLRLGEEVQQALAECRPVVALESTIISHGMPFPENVATALRVEQTVRDHGAVPATIAIWEGRLVAGLNETEITQLGERGLQVAKASHRDIPFLIASGQPGATTVAATMFVAAQAGIGVFATGGIGGVHRGGQESFDISADLQALAHTNVAVVCAGAKSILDLPLTLEYLETHGVPVIGYRTDAFPAFYSRDSGLPVDYRLDTPAAIAQAVRTKWALGLNGGVVIANPVPEPYSMDPAAMQALIDQALADADAQAIRGKAITPFLLARIKALSEGKSLVSNIQLVLNNAALAAQVAGAMAG